MTFDNGQDRVPGIFTRNNDEAPRTSQQYWKWQNLFTKIDNSNNETGDPLSLRGPVTNESDVTLTWIEDYDTTGADIDLQETDNNTNSETQGLSETYSNASSSIKLDDTQSVLRPTDFHEMDKKMVMDSDLQEIISIVKTEDTMASAKEIHLPSDMARPSLHTDGQKK
jgi:hypothetical protein